LTGNSSWLNFTTVKPIKGNCITRRQKAFALNPFTKMKKYTIITWTIRIILALFLLKTALFKLEPDPNAVSLFTGLGFEPTGRIAVGILEFLAALLLLIPVTSKAGSILAIFLMVGAIATHLFRIGISLNGDPSTFILAVVLLLLAVGLLVLPKGRTQY
jgi:uncharacterized membrane protein YphA (DoxX/SURF4 family)